jgi:hypothetical protein
LKEFEEINKPDYSVLLSLNFWLSSDIAEELSTLNKSDKIN